MVKLKKKVQINVDHRVFEQYYAQLIDVDHI